MHFVTHAFIGASFGQTVALQLPQELVHPVLSEERFSVDDDR